MQRFEKCYLIWINWLKSKCARKENEDENKLIYELNKGINYEKGKEVILWQKFNMYKYEENGNPF